MRHVAEEMMCHVGVGNVMMDVIQEPEVAIHSAEGALEPAPLLASVVGKTNIRVLEVSNQDQPEVDHDVRHKVGLGEPEPALGLT